ncbi:hypothetical protein [Amycolatopsis sp. WAC 01416]|uniref:hypothetical protein n=1 Tax=Amycolatopsis sp. WAC 01416 TaxID=2203196 RepID=UPI000F7A4088|nr:hypothetical protein [Amycolatopsis sp. WAC 01416]
MLAMARLVATTPVAFPAFGERGPAWRRADAKRLDSVLTTTSRERVRSATDGAARLVKVGFGGPPEAQVNTIGAVMAGDDGLVRAELRALTALAISTVSSHYTPDDDAAAALWLDFTRNYHLRRRGTR